MGPVISQESATRIEELVAQAVKDGARPLVDGRSPSIPGYPRGHFSKPTVLEGLPRSSGVAQAEIFGPVLSLYHVDTLEQAITMVNEGVFGNQASLFTSSGANARQFRYEAEAGHIGINVGVAAPMAFFPFSGARGSFLGDRHGQGRDAIEFYTQEKVVVERWPKAWTRRF